MGLWGLGRFELEVIHQDLGWVVKRMCGLVEARPTPSWPEAARWKAPLETGSSDPQATARTVRASAKSDQPPEPRTRAKRRSCNCIFILKQVGQERQIIIVTSIELARQINTAAFGEGSLNNQSGRSRQHISALMAAE